jgi:hypothetical protein
VRASRTVPTVAFRDGFSSTKEGPNNDVAQVAQVAGQVAGQAVNRLLAQLAAPPKGDGQRQAS